MTVTKLPDNYDEIFLEMTADLVLDTSRPYEELSYVEISQNLYQIQKELRELGEVLRPNTKRGHELHTMYEDLNEEVRMRTQ